MGIKYSGTSIMKRKKCIKRSQNLIEPKQIKEQVTVLTFLLKFPTFVINTEQLSVNL